MLLPLASLALADVGIVYRGRLQSPTGSIGTAARKITVKFYKEESGGASESTVSRTITPDSDGNFQISLEGAAVTNATAKGNANLVGITIGENGRELTLRSLIPPVLRAYKAKLADGLAPGASVRHLTSDSVRAREISARDSMRGTDGFLFPDGEENLSITHVTTINGIGTARNLRRGN